MSTPRNVPLTIKWIFITFMAILIPTYWISYGPTNFLWFSDVALFLTFFAVLFESSLLASMAVVGGILLESLWAVDFFALLFFNVHLTTLSDYMFDASLSIWLRLLSLFHLVLLPLMVWLVVRLGYHRRAWIYQTLIAWIVIPTTWLLTTPEQNTNWVYSYEYVSWLNLGPISFLILESIGVAIIFALSHFLIIWMLKIFQLLRCLCRSS